MKKQKKAIADFRLDEKTPLHVWDTIASMVTTAQITPTIPSDRGFQSTTAEVMQNLLEKVGYTAEVVDNILFVSTEHGRVGAAVTKFLLAPTRVRLSRAHMTLTSAAAQRRPSYAM